MIFLTIVTIIIGIPVILGIKAILFPIRNVYDISDCIHKKYFAWETWRDGIKFSTAELRKYKNKDKYFIHHHGIYKDPTEHPNYQKFLEEVNLIMKEIDDKNKHKLIKLCIK